jgi:Flp pilus assembly protein TadD
VEVKSPHFVVRSDAGEKEARRTAWQFEQIRAVFEKQWPWARLDPGRPLVILALKNERSMVAVLSPEVVHDPKGLGGLFFHGPDRYYLCLRTDLRKVLARAEPFYPNPYQVVYHEYVHLLLTLNFSEMPAWLGEGLAEYWGATEVDDGDLLLAQPIFSHVLLLRRGLMPLGKFYATDGRSVAHGANNATSIFYAESWALVHYLFNGAGDAGRNALNRYSSDLRNGIPEAEARQRLPSEGELTVALGKYVLQNRLPYRKGPAPEPPDSMKAYSAQALLPAQTALLKAGFLARHGRPDRASAAIEEASRLAASGAEIEETRGMLALGEEKLADAEGHFSRALELDCQSSYAYFIHAQLLLGHESGPAALGRIETELVQAVKLNPDFAPAWGELSLVGLRRGRSPQEAEVVARRGLALEPSSSVLRSTLATVLLAAGRNTEAREEALRAQLAARSNSEREAAQAILDQAKSP